MGGGKQPRRPWRIGRAARLCAMALAMLGLAPAPCRAEVSVSPTFMLFDGEPGTKAITVKNSGPREEVYRVSLLDLRMESDGRMVVAKEPREGEHFADEMVRFAPRELVLAPGASAVVRFRVAALRAGEYRVHVLVQQVPDIGALTKPPFLREDGLTVDLQAVFGVAIPLIIRSGELAASLAFGEARLTRMPDGGPAVVLKLLRGGERSLRGAVSLTFEGKEIGLYDGIALYAPVSERDLLLPLPADLGELREGSLVARFAEPEDIRGAVAAETPVQLH
jgi:hypothetical protein